VQSEKSFKVHLGENTLLITAANAKYTRTRILEIVIETILFEYERKDSKELDRFMSMLNLRHQNIQESRIK
jgi:hypothetical protein